MTHIIKEDVSYYRTLLAHCIMRATSPSTKYRTYDDHLLAVAATNFLDDKRNDFLETCLRAELDYPFVLHILAICHQKQKRLYAMEVKTGEQYVCDWLCQRFGMTRARYDGLRERIYRMDSGRLAQIIAKHSLQIPTDDLHASDPEGGASEAKDTVH